MASIDRHKHTDEHPATLTQTEARQGSGRLMNLRVVVVGLLLAVLGGLAVGAAFYLPAERQTPVSGAAPKP